MQIRSDLKCDACGQPIKKAEDALMVWEPWHTYYEHQDWLKLKPVMKLVHKAEPCSKPIMKEYSHSMELSQIATGEAREELNAMVYDMELSRLNLSLLLRRIFSDCNEAEFFKFTMEDYQNYRAKSVEW